MEYTDTIPGTDLVIIQDRECFSFGIDSILLSSFARIKSGATIVDVGSGNGILALRCSALYRPREVIAIEIQKDVADMARRSVERNGLSSRIRVLDTSLAECESRFEPGSVDAVISNPPYFKKDCGLIADDPRLALARHEIAMTLEDLFRFSARILKPRGKLFLVHRPERLADALVLGREYKIEPRRMQLVYPRRQQPPRQVLLEFEKHAPTDFRVEVPLVVYDGEHYTQEVLRLYENR